MNAPFHPSPFLQYGFAPVHDEIVVDDLEVIGSLPRELGGMFLRIGPNPQFAPRGRYHWFDGDGMIHGIVVRDGRASYRNRWVRTRGFELEREAGKPLWAGLTEMPQFQNPPHGMLFKNAANTAMVWHDRRLLALWEGGEPHQIALPSLETVGPYDYAGKLRSPFTAHPKVDPVSGEMMFFGYNPMGPDFLLYSVVSGAGDLLRTVPIQIPRGVMMHDFAITERHTLFMDLPLVFDPTRLLRGETPFFFDRDAPSRFGIVPQVMPNFISYALLRFEINVRASTIIGAVGGGGIGEELRLSIGRGHEAKTLAIVLLLFATIVAVDQLSAWLRRYLVGKQAFEFGQ